MVTNTIRWLRVSYWWGIILDAVMAILMLFPQRLADITKIDVESVASFDYGVRYAVPLMMGWTVLLFWADRKPLARKDILLITLVPVVAGYVIFEFYSMEAGYATVGNTIPLLVMQAAMSATFIFSYLNAGRAGIQP